jgi:hypothetical protein
MAEEKRPRKKTHTILPPGFGIGEFSNDIIIIDFFEEDEDGELYIYNSVGFSKAQATNLARGLLEAMEE